MDTDTDTDTDTLLPNLGPEDMHGLTNTYM